MTISTMHIFKVWHPKDGLPATYVEAEFHFNMPVTRTKARELVEKVEGYSIARVRPPKERGVYIRKPRARKAKC